MRAEIISIGTELLLGAILNTNAKFLSEALAQNAIDVYHQVTVGDNPGRIKESFLNATKRSDILVCSGGLGPTEDDVTASSIASFLNRPQKLHLPTLRYIKGILQNRRMRFTKLLKKQCYVPQGAVILKNNLGTAPGIFCEFIYENQKKWLLALPGPPREMRPLFEEKMLPLLLKRAGLKKGSLVIRSIRIVGLGESQVAQKVTDLLKLKPPLTVGIYAKPGEVELKLMAKTHIHLKNKIRKIETIIRGRLKNHVYGTDHDTLSSVVGSLLRSTRQTIAIAESCTGGLLSHDITNTPGSSEYFLGSIISYNNLIKTMALGVDEALLKKYGAVSSQIALAMANNVRKSLGANLGLAITGIAGPGGGTGKKPVGLVYIALAAPKKTLVRKYRFFGTRPEIKARASQTALDLLRNELS